MRLETVPSRSGLLPTVCECPFCGYEAAVKKARKIETLFSRDGYTWIYRTGPASCCLRHHGGRRLSPAGELFSKHPAASLIGKEVKQTKI